MTNSIGEREWLLYRFWDRNGRLLYIGQTGRMAMARWLEHVRDQPWAHEIATMQVDPTTYLSLADVLRVEKFAIETELPLHNVEHNLNNPYRVPRSRHPATVSSRTRPHAPQRQPFVPQRRMSRRQRRAIFIGAVWLVLTVVLWATIASTVGAGPAFEVAAVVAGGVIVAARHNRPRRRRRR